MPDNYFASNFGMWRDFDTRAAQRGDILELDQTIHLLHQKQHPRDLSSEHISQFLTHPGVDGHVAASTQNQTLNAFIFLYRQVLKIELPLRRETVRSRSEYRRSALTSASLQTADPFSRNQESRTFLLRFTSIFFLRSNPRFEEYRDRSSKNTCDDHAEPK